MLQRLVIDSCHVVADGQAFGEAGPYEVLSGRATFAVDPHHLLNQPICDITRAPVDAAGNVICTSDIWLLRPVDGRRANGTLIFDALNRGRKIALSALQEAGRSDGSSPAAEFGDGLLMRQGMTLAACAWQADVAEGLDRMYLHVPAVPVSGLVRCELIVDRPTDMAPLSDAQHRPYVPADAEQVDATLTVRDTQTGPRTLIARERWSFVSPSGSAGPAAAPTHVRLKSGFEPGRLYQVIYRGEHPPVAGLGFAVVRDFVSFLRTELSDVNPLAGADGLMTSRAIAFGVSQSGLFLRRFLSLGFNEDETGRRVFDGMLVCRAGAAMGSFNHRFVQPSRLDRGHADYGYPTEVYPSHDLAVPDPYSPRNEGLSTRLVTRGMAPKVIYVNSSADYWDKSASLIHTDPLGERDIEPPAHVRIYHVAGTQHGSGAFPPGDAGYTPLSPLPVGRYPASTADCNRVQRALFLAMEAWVRDGTLPPDSCYPTIAAGTLVTREAAAMQWPVVPGAPFPQGLRQPRVHDYGPEWPQGVISREPPEPGAEYRALAPALNVDGNEQAGLLLPEVAVPVATYTGWNYRHQDRGAPEAMAAILGSYFPFPATAAQAAQSGDARLSLEQRYAGRADYLDRVRLCAEGLAAMRLLLAEDIPAVMERAAAQWDAVAGAVPPVPTAQARA